MGKHSTLILRISSSGSLENGEICFRMGKEPTARSLSIKIPQDFNQYGLQGVFLDTGAGGCLIPYHIARRLGIRKPFPKSKQYCILVGVTGVAVAYESLTGVVVSLRKGQQAAASHVLPLVLLYTAPTVTAGAFYPGSGPQWEGLSDKDSGILPFIRPKETLGATGMKKTFLSPRQKCPIHKSRLPLTTNQWDRFPYVILGRQWLEGHNISFSLQSKPEGKKYEIPPDIVEISDLAE